MRAFSVFLLSAGLLFPAQQSLEEAWKLAGDGRRDQAIDVLRRLVQTSPGDPDAHLFLGSLLMEKDVHDESIAQLTEGVRLRPNSAEAQNALGEGYIHFAEPKLARAPLEKAVALNPKFAVAQINLGLVLSQLTEYKLAAVQLDRAIAMLGKHKDAAYAHYLRAKVYTLLDNNPRKAATELEQAVALDPKMAEAWSDLGQTRKTLLDREGALQAFELAVRADPRDPIAEYRLGSEYLDRNNPNLAIGPLQLAYHFAPQDQSILNALQIALRQLGRTVEANQIKAQLSEQLQKKDQGRQDAVKAITLNNEGAAFEKTGNIRDAVIKYRQALDLAPDHVGIRVNYGVALLRLGQWTQGLNELKEAQRRDPNNPKIQAAIRDAEAQLPKGQH